MMKEWKKILLLTAAALIYRVVLFFFFQKHVIPGSDQIQNILLGQNLASGDFYGVLDTYWHPFYPIIIGIVTFFVDSVTLPSVIISIVAGTLMIPLTYYFVRQSYGEKVALIAGLIAVVYPHLINSVFKLGTENIYFLLVVGAVFVGWKGIQQSSFMLYALAGAFLGFAYLTRPEAIGYLIFFLIFAGIKDLWKGQRFSLESVKMAAAFLITFLVLAAPYIYYLKAETGVWTFSGKTTVNLAGGVYSEPLDPAIVKEPEPMLSLPEVFFYNLVYTQKVLAYLFPIFLFMPIGLGIFGTKWSTDRFRREIYLIAFCGVTIAGYAVSVVQARYFYILIPIVFGWLACGILEIQHWLKESASGWRPVRLPKSVASWVFVAVNVLLIYLYVFPVHFFASSSTELWKANAYEEREAGIWIGEHARKGALVFSATRTPTLYANAEQLEPKSMNPQALLSQIEDRKADFVVIGERSFDRHPYLEGFEKHFRDGSNFKLVFEKQKPGYGILVFERMKRSNTEPE